jgi:hypothetical protein
LKDENRGDASVVVILILSGLFLMTLAAIGMFEVLGRSDAATMLCAAALAPVLALLAVEIAKRR